MLGSFCENNGFTTKKREKYILEPKTEFSKYNIHDTNTEIGKLLADFKNICFSKYNAMSIENYYLLEFPHFLISATTRLNHGFTLPQNMFLQPTIMYFFGYIIYMGNEVFNHDDSANTIVTMIHEKYADILKTNKKFDFQKLLETATWSTVEHFLQEVSKTKASTEEKSIFSARIIRHYLFLNLKKAFKDVFFMKNSCENIFKEIAEDAEKLAESVKCKITLDLLKQTETNNSFEQNTPAKIYDILDPQEISENTSEYQKFSTAYCRILSESIGSYSKINSSSIRFKYDAFCNNFRDEPASQFYGNWYKARNLVFALKFDNSDSDKVLIEEALQLYKEAFDKYKYFAGKNLEQFLFDAISADVYFNKKNLKDIIDNTQNNTNESSILKPGKSYWEFAYAVGILPENSKKTYLASFYAEKNFWNAFPVSKFENSDAAYKKFEDDISNEELNILNITDKFLDPKKSDNLLSSERKDFRQPLGKRQYSNLSIAILKAEKSIDFDCIETYIRIEDVEKLVKNDESGASPLIRALNEYKNCVYGFSKEYRKIRAEILFEYQKDFDSVEKSISKKLKFSDANFEDEELNIFLNNSCEKFKSKFINKFLDNIKSYLKNFNEPPIYKSLQEKAMLIKSRIILPLIEKIGKSEFSNTLLDEAIVLDTHHCVSALQLAIDSFDFEITKCIIENLPKEQSNLAKIYISEEYVTPLQYAIRKYDLLMQCWDRYNLSQPNLPLKYHKIPNRKETAGGIIYTERNRLAKNEQLKWEPLKHFYIEECGIVYKSIPQTDYKNDNIILETQRNLKKIIINLLANNTNPISVDNFYYLAEQCENTWQPYAAVLDLTEDLIATGNADLSGVNEEWFTNIVPEETLLARCIRLRSYGMLFNLLKKYPEKFKNIINERILGTGATKEDIRYETDIHMFVLNQIESTKKWLDKKEFKDNEQKQNDYGKQIAHTMNTFLTLFKKAGADFTIKDQAGRSVKDLLTEWKDKFPKNSIPPEIL